MIKRSITDESSLSKIHPTSIKLEKKITESFYSKDFWKKYSKPFGVSDVKFLKSQHFGNGMDTAIYHYDQVYNGIKVFGAKYGT